MGALRSTEGTPDGRKNASPLPLPAVLVVMAAVGNTTPAEPAQVVSRTKMFSVTW
jgi:hypothetical protein